MRCEQLITLFRHLIAVAILSLLLRQWQQKPSPRIRSLTSRIGSNGGGSGTKVCNKDVPLRPRVNCLVSTLPIVLTATFRGGVNTVLLDTVTNSFHQRETSSM